LKRLVEHELLAREDYREPGQRTCERYRLTDKGADLLPALTALLEWGSRWLDDRGGPIGLRHRDCGERVELTFRCSAGHDVEPDELDLARRRRRRS
jgi:DNA-binding PadR family transcriptional regulator